MQVIEQKTSAETTVSVLISLREQITHYFIVICLFDRQTQALDTLAALSALTALSSDISSSRAVEATALAMKRYEHVLRKKILNWNPQCSNY